MLLAPDQVIGRYQVIRFLSTGANGEVYLAFDVEDPNRIQVALKIIRPGLLSDIKITQRFKNEIAATRQVIHPNVVRAYEFFNEQSIQGYAMEYIAGGDLAARLKHGKLEAGEALNVLRQLSSGLVAIHRQGIIHRDLKPGNILLTCEGVPKIGDFGVARLRGGLLLTTVGAAVGTPLYLPPEYLQTGKCDERSDIYSLGVMGYQMIAGEVPFRAQFFEQLVYEQVHGPITPLIELAPHCPIEVARAVHRAMHSDPNQRHQSAEELYEDLCGTIVSRQIVARGIPAARATPSGIDGLGVTGITLIASKTRLGRALLVGGICLLLTGMALGAFQAVKQRSALSETLVTAPIAHFQADEISEDATYKVEVWPDPRTSITAVQTVKDLQPRLMKNALNGHSAVRFNGVSTYMRVDSLAEQLRGLTEATVVYVVRSTGNAVQYVWSVHTADRAQEPARTGFVENGKVREQANTAKSLGITADSVPPYPINQFAVYSVVIKVESMAMYQNGTFVSNMALTKPVQFSAVHFFSIGQEWDEEVASDFLNGDLAELMVFDHALKDTERNVIESKLAEKYQLPRRAVFAADTLARTN